MPDPEAAGEAWSLVFACPDGPGGFVRVVRWPDRAWFWGYVVSPAAGLVVVRDHDVAPLRGRSPVLRADGLWCELTEETPGEHWSVGLEAFGVRLDDPLDAEHGERGERLPVGLDVEWETGAGAVGSVHGVLLVGAARLEVDGTGVFEHSSFTGNPWVGAWRRVTWQRDATHGATVDGDAVAVDADADRLPVAVRAGGVAFTVTATAVVPATSRVVLARLDAPAGSGWLEWCQGDAAPARPPAG